MSETISNKPTPITIGQYTIVSKLGEGGMGEVYRARDGRLDRNVAIKILPAKFATDSDRLNRFEQEARATSALNHPNILTVYDIGKHDGSPYLVAELLEGEELRERLDHGSIPLRRVIEYAQQIVSGLEAAHGKGIIHRDLKPENLFITDDERVKILDFGIAKLSEPGQPGSLTASEDATRRVLTNPGVVIGTVGYMAPEQVRGEKADQRSDIFSFGAILHEMISGRRAFRRDTVAETMTAILKEEPEDLSVTNPGINPALERIVQRCLEKKPDRRFHTAHDLGFALESLSAPTTTSGKTLTTVATDGVETELATWRARIPWIAFAAAALIAMAALFIAFRASRNSRSSAELQAVRFNILVGQRTTGVGQIALSPDGRNVVISTLYEGKAQLWLRPLDSLTARPLPNTEGAVGFPIWSPDSRAIAFAVAGKLKKYDFADGSVQSICNIPSADRRGFDGTWNRDGTILFFVGGTTIYRVQATGGEPAPIPGVNDSAAGGLVRWPTFLPDGHHFLYLVTPPQQGNSEVAIASLDGKDSRRLLTANSNAMYAASATGEGYLLFARSGALLAQRFDANTLALSGEPKVLVEQVRVNFNSRAFFSVSDNGTLVYDQSTDSDSRQLTWFDREAKELGGVGEKAAILQFKLSPDQKRTAVAKRDPGTGVFDLWVMDMARGAVSRITSGSSDVTTFVWSPDSNYIAWESAKDHRYMIVRKLASGAGQEEILLEADKPVFANSWSGDGKYILYTRNDLQTKNDIWLLPLEGDRKPFAYFQSPADDRAAAFSPDGRWVAYQSSESGSNEIYVQTFPASGGKWPVSNKGGVAPMWRGDGKELFYVSPEGKLMAVEIKVGSTFEPGVPNVLFDMADARARPNTPYDIAADGQRFLILSGRVDANPSSIAVVLNWTADLKK
jgi:Tol biopolymer transport system component